MGTSWRRSLLDRCPCEGDARPRSARPTRNRRLRQGPLAVRRDAIFTSASVLPIAIRSSSTTTEGDVASGGRTSVGETCVSQWRIGASHATSRSSASRISNAVRDAAVERAASLTSVASPPVTATPARGNLVVHTLQQLLRRHPPAEFFGKRGSSEADRSDHCKERHYHRRCKRHGQKNLDEREAAPNGTCPHDLAPVRHREAPSSPDA